MAELDKVQEQIRDLLLLQVPIEEIRLHPDDVRDLRLEVKDRPLGHTFYVTNGKESICGVRIVRDETVQVGKMHVVKSKSLGSENESQQAETDEASDCSLRPDTKHS